MRGEQEVGAGDSRSQNVSHNKRWKSRCSGGAAGVDDAPPVRLSPRPEVRRADESTIHTGFVAATTEVEDGVIARRMGGRGGQRPVPVSCLMLSHSFAREVDGRRSPFAPRIRRRVKVNSNLSLSQAGEGFVVTYFRTKSPRRRGSAGHTRSLPSSLVSSNASLSSQSSTDPHPHLPGHPLPLLLPVQGLFHFPRLLISSSHLSVLPSVN